MTCTSFSGHTVPTPASKRSGRLKYLLAGFAAGVFLTLSICGAALGGYFLGQRADSPSAFAAGPALSAITAEAATATASVPMPALAAAAPMPAAATLASAVALAPTPAPVPAPASAFTTVAAPPAVAAAGQPIPQVVANASASVVSIVTATRSGDSGGTGIIYSADGLIITNAHVIADARQIKVFLQNGQSYDASVTGSDVKSDLAVLKINAPDLKAAEFGDSGKLLVGETAIAIGNPAELEYTVTVGVISAINREIDVNGRYMSLLQTDAAINFGNSGGPLLNLSGQVIGINSVKVTSLYTEGLGFAIPGNNALPIIRELIENGHVTSRPALGITVENVTARTADYYGYPQGVMVRSVSQGSGAEAGGLQTGDIITAFKGVALTTQAELVREKDKCKAGDSVSITVYRTGTKETLNLTIVLSETVS